uniref:Uncharacterized protein n=1 Tax=Arundo donax TaxID=35708 RepID=A0A0A8ZXD4_ARUDO
MLDSSASHYCTPYPPLLGPNPTLTVSIISAH